MKRKKYENMLRANILNESRWLSENKNMTESSVDYQNEGMGDLFNPDYLNEITNNIKEPVNEAIGTTFVIGLILSSGKFIDLLGTVYRKINNKFSKNKIDKTKLEKFGEKIDKFFIKSIKFILTKVGVPEKEAGKLAQILLICVITGLLGTGLDLSKYGSLAYTGKMFANLTKSYEVGVAILSIALYVFSDEIKNAGDYMHIPHALESCIEDKSISNAVKGDNKIIDCVVHNMKNH